MATPLEDGLEWHTLHDMTSIEGTCPSPLETIPSPRSCSHSGSGCSSVYYPTLGISFTKVCGQAIGHHYDSADAFSVFNSSIDTAYVDDLSITYDSPCHHLWTNAAGHSESGFIHVANCPCAGNNGSPPPSCVQDHYYCESGNVGIREDRWYDEDPLWDGKGCPTGNTCCDPPNLPWFHRIINLPSIADIEMRLCQDEGTSNEDVSVELFELYVY